MNLVSMAGRLTAPNMGHYAMSKHATIAFSDAVRKENKKYGVKVSTIEPIAYRTTMATLQSLNGAYDKQWNESSQEVRDFYGEEFFRNLKDAGEKGNVIFPPGNNIFEVVDKLVEAVRAPEPEIRYQVIPCKFLPRFFFAIVPWLPTEVVDVLSDSRAKLHTRTNSFRN